MVKYRKIDSGDFVMNECPKDCPFRDRISYGIMFCSFSIYADQLEPKRFTRTEIMPDGTVNYHLPPDCDVYERYKNRASEITALKKKYDRYGTKRFKRFEPDLFVTGHKHVPLQKHRYHF